MEEDQEQPIAEPAEPVAPKPRSGEGGKLPSSADEPTQPPVPPKPPSGEGGRPRSGAGWRRLGLGLGAIVLAIVAGVLVSVLTVDLGPDLEKLAEQRGSTLIQRPIHIGRLSMKLTPGVFQVDDLVIDGLTPSDRPFLKAKRIVLSVPWWSIVTRNLVVDWVEMSDWDMVIETFPNGRHNFPKFTPDPKTPKRPSRFTTTVRSVLASRGRFTYVDHGTPWSIEARDLRVHVYRTLNDYQGDASFGGSTIRLQAYEAFNAQMRTHFRIDPPMIRLTRIDLRSDGANTVLDGEVDTSRWPEQIYRITSQIDFQTQKNIFFHGQNFSASGDGEFIGAFHLFKGGRELKGKFTSPMAGVKIGASNWSFPDLRGDVLWLPRKLEITDTTSGLYGGRAKFDYRLAPLGVKGVPTRASWDVAYRDVDLAQLTDFLQTDGIRLAGRITGRNRLDWPLGKWIEKRGEGEVNAASPAGVATMTREFDAQLVAQQYAFGREAGPFNPHRPLGYVPIAGHVKYTLGQKQITLDDSWTATPKTYVEFNGRTDYGVDSRIPFHVTSLDWQESDRVLAGIMTAFGAPTGGVEIGGHGQFDGVMLKSFGKPRIEGVFSGEHMRAWDTDWGKGQAKVAIENSYVDVSESSIRAGDSEIAADGRFSLGYPRKDEGEEINARVRIAHRPLGDLRHAFLLDDWRVDGTISGEYHLYGNYETPYGYGQLRIDDGVAYGEAFEHATATLQFEGSGVRVKAIEMKKSTGAVTGAAWVGWEGDYSFEVAGDRIPVESLKSVQFPRAPLSGLLTLKAGGAATFENPSYDVNLWVPDLFAGEEGIGKLDLDVKLRGEQLHVDLKSLSSPRVTNIWGGGRIALTDQMDAEMSLQFQDASLAPYLRFFAPRLSPFNTVLASGSIRIVGELTDLEHLAVDATVKTLNLELFDYTLANEGPIELSLNQDVAQIGRFKLVGVDTQLELEGNINLLESTIDVQASGDANLGILQGPFPLIRSSGAATLRAAATGSLSNPVLSGSATIANGRIRHFSLPHSLESINGRISFDSAGIRVDDVQAKLGGGEVTLGGRIAMKGFQLGDLSLTATGEQMHVRYPEGFRSVIDADLALRGDMASPLLSGTVTVHDAVYSKRTDPNSLFSLTAGPAPAAEAAAGATLPLRFDIQVDAPSTLRVENNLARLVASADLKLQGTYDRPLLFGRANIDRGTLTYLGNRYVITRGSIGFANPMRIEPYFDVEAETRVRVPGETYRITLGVTGTTTNSNVNLNSDPPLSSVDILGLLLGQTTNLQNAELRAMNAGASSRAEEDLLKAATASLLTGKVATPVTRAVEQTFGIDFQIAPTVGSETDPLTPSAKITLGRRLSSSLYITFTRALGTGSSEQIIILEYDQNERLGWVVTQNGDRTFALEFRVRHIF